MNCILIKINGQIEKIIGPFDTVENAYGYLYKDGWEWRGENFFVKGCYSSAYVRQLEKPE